METGDDMEGVGDTYDGWVTIRDAHARSWGRAQATLRRAPDGALLGEITAPLWMVSLSGGVGVRFEGGDEGILRVREIRAMDGPVATVAVEVAQVDERSAPRTSSV
jgi:hypothetical protein